MIPLLIVTALILAAACHHLLLHGEVRHGSDPDPWSMDQPWSPVRGEDFEIAVGTDGILRTLTHEGQVDIGDDELRRVLGEEVA